jgi:hypothetical protein
VHTVTNSPAGASTICAQIKQRISIPWLWQYHNLTGDPKPGGRCRSPFYHDKNPDFEISRDGSRFTDWGKPDHWGDVITFEQLATGCTPGEAIRKLRELASISAGNGAPSFTVNARSQCREYQDCRPLRPMTLDFLERGSTDDFKRLAALRCLAIEPLETASATGVLRFATLIDGPPGAVTCRAWIVTDRTRYVVEARRLDGQPWKHIGGAKSWTLPGGSKGRKRWPLGIMEVQSCRAIALVEGAPDFLAAFHWIWAEDRSDIAPVAILGASMSIHPVALPLFRGKRVRIFPHYDAERFNGFDAARRWEAQLRVAGAIVDCFDLTGLTRSDGRPVSDLNDLCSVSHDQWHDQIREILP